MFVSSVPNGRCGRFDHNSDNSDTKHTRQGPIGIGGGGCRWTLRDSPRGGVYFAKGTKGASDWPSPAFGPRFRTPLPGDREVNLSSPLRGAAGGVRDVRDVLRICLPRNAPSRRFGVGLRPRRSLPAYQARAVVTSIRFTADRTGTPHWDAIRLLIGRDPIATLAAVDRNSLPWSLR